MGELQHFVEVSPLKAFTIATAAPLSASENDSLWRGLFGALPKAGIVGGVSRSSCRLAVTIRAHSRS